MIFVIVYSVNCRSKDAVHIIEFKYIYIYIILQCIGLSSDNLCFKKKCNHVPGIFKCILRRKNSSDRHVLCWILGSVQNTFKIKEFFFLFPQK